MVTGKTIIGLAIAIMGACTYNARFSDCEVSCATDLECPDGLACGAEGLCRASGATQACGAVLGTQPSCAGLPSTCGPNGDESCCSTATPIPGGTFYRGYDVASDGMYSDMAHPATVSAFVLDRFEVTVGRFRAFVDAGMGTQASPPAAGTGAHAKIPGSGWDANWDGQLAADAATLDAALQCDLQRHTWTTTAGANEDLPVNCVTWYEAAAFCAWDQGFLPTDAEWNYAAAGGDEQRAYPWSHPADTTAIDCAHANYNPNYPSGPFCVNGLIGMPNRVGSESPMGDDRWGHADLGGNVGEWVLDGYAPYTTTCNDCAELTSTSNRVVRASDYANAAPTVRSAFRKYTTPTGNRDPKIGFRCARPTI